MEESKNNKCPKCGCAHAVYYEKNATHVFFECINCKNRYKVLNLNSNTKAGV